jgi:UDP-glucuronate 4-epimerase
MVTLVTGAAGFIGAAVSKKLLDLGYDIIGIDNLNDYYSPAFKKERLKFLCSKANFEFRQLDIRDDNALRDCMKGAAPKKVINLAAEVGVRNSIQKPADYISTNILGFLNILEACREFHIERLIYASSSSVYGTNISTPFSTTQRTDSPMSIYASSKKANELMAHTYSHLYGFQTVGLRFFTVYGPWGRPDMAIFKFVRAIRSGKEISIFNQGHHRRDFTYIDDIIDGITRIHEFDLAGDAKFARPNGLNLPYSVYNLGGENPEQLLDCISILEKLIGIKSTKKFLPIQLGDMKETFADTTPATQDFGYSAKTCLNEGLGKFVSWYLENEDLINKTL